MKNELSNWQWSSYTKTNILGPLPHSKRNRALFEGKKLLPERHKTTYPERRYVYIINVSFVFSNIDLIWEPLWNSFSLFFENKGLLTVSFFLTSFNQQLDAKLMMESPPFYRFLKLSDSRADMRCVCFVDLINIKFSNFENSVQVDVIWEIDDKLCFFGVH